MKAFVVFTIGRQVNGDLVTMKPERGFTKASEADKFLAQLTPNVVEKIQSTEGPVEFVCERAAFEIEID